jgi:hypothetical protein
MVNTPVCFENHYSFLSKKSKPPRIWNGLGKDLLCTTVSQALLVDIYSGHEGRLQSGMRTMESTRNARRQNFTNSVKVKCKLYSNLNYSQETKLVVRKVCKIRSTFNTNLIWRWRWFLMDQFNIDPYWHASVMRKSMYLSLNNLHELREIRKYYWDWDWWRQIRKRSQCSRYFHLSTNETIHH